MYNDVIEVAFWLKFLLIFYPLFPVRCKSYAHKRRRRRMKIIAARKIPFANSYRYRIEFIDIYCEKRKHSMLLSINDGGGLRQLSSVLCVQCGTTYTRALARVVFFSFFSCFLAPFAMLQFKHRYRADFFTAKKRRPVNRLGFRSF